MPLYDYQCNNCELIFEAFHSLDGQPPSCPSCTCPQVTRLISLMAFRVAGDNTAVRVEAEIKRRLGRGSAKDALRLAEKAMVLAGSRPDMCKIRAARDKLRTKLKTE
jgi:putative FmdB family regulatory protein